MLFAAFAIVAAANGVNITDGLDGLSGGTVAIAFVAYMLIALLNTPAQPNLALLCALIIGALLGFLWFNVHPGADLHRRLRGAVAGCHAGGHRADHRPDPGPPADRDHLRHRDRVGHPPGLRTSRLSGGKRLFRMSPIHHHFELGGWDEEKITIRFWIVGILAALLGVTLFLASVDRLR